MTDRRRHERFKINGRAFVYYESHAQKIAEITDISKGGVAFSYMGSAETVNQMVSLEMILPDSTRFMEKLPCKTISDCATGPGVCKDLMTRRCSVQFVDLTDDQKNRIECFMNDFCWMVPK